MWTSSEIATTSHNMCVEMLRKVGKPRFSCWWEEGHGMEVDAHEMLAPRFLFGAMGSREGRGCPPKVGTCVFVPITCILIGILDCSHECTDNIEI